MPPYSGHTYKIILRPQNPALNVHLESITPRDWELCPFSQLPQFPNQYALGRIFNLEVELFFPNPSLQPELEALGYEVRPHDDSRPMSIYPGVALADRNFVQVFQDILWQSVNEYEGSIDYAIVAATPEDWVLVCRLQRELGVNDERPYPDTISEEGRIYPIIAYFQDNEVTVVANEPEISRFLIREPELKITYRYVDRTPEGDIGNTDKWWAMYRKKVHKREKRLKRKMEQKAEMGANGSKAKEMQQQGKKEKEKKNGIGAAHQTKEDEAQILDNKLEKGVEAQVNGSKKKEKDIAVTHPVRNDNEQTSNKKDVHIKPQEPVLETPKPRQAYATVAAQPAPKTQTTVPKLEYKTIPAKSTQKTQEAEQEYSAYKTVSGKDGQKMEEAQESSHQEYSYKVVAGRGKAKDGRRIDKTRSPLIQNGVWERSRESKR